jgi:carbon storage regulator
MLVLSRRENEEILIGNDIRIRVLCVRRKMVSLAIAAPTDVPILRSELAERSAAVADARGTLYRETVTAVGSGSL